MSSYNSFPLQTYPANDPLAQPLSYAPTPLPQQTLAQSSATTAATSTVAIHKRRVCGMTVRSWIILVFWLLASVLLGYYIYRVSSEFKTSQDQPSTVVTEELADSREMPAVTICNWNTEGPDPNFPAPCPFCYIYFVGCQFSNRPCPSDIFLRLNAAVVPDGNATFYCYQFNINPNSPYVADGTGFSNSISLTFEVTKPPNDTIDARLGCQVTFHKQTEKPSVFSETNYILPWTEFTYNLKEVKTTFADERVTLSYDVRTSAIGLAGVDLSPILPNAVRLKIAFTFSSLNQENVKEVSTYTRSNFLGDLAGMASLLLGLDFIKFARGFVALTKVKTKGWAPFANVFST